MGALARKIKSGFRNFMVGRYGTDKLNMTILVCGVVICLVSLFIPVQGVKLGMTFAAYGLLFWAMFRCFSRSTYKRYRENRKYLMFLDALKDREHRYYECPKCHQPVRVPRSKGKISITCPKCKEKFVKKT